MTYDGRIEAQFTVPSGATVTSTVAGVSVSIPLPANAYYLSDALTLLQSQLNTLSGSAGWTLSLSTGANATGLVSITGPGTWSLAFTNVEFRQLFGFAADLIAVTGTQIGTSQARSLWIPDCPVALDGDPRVAPVITDQRVTLSPTGATYGLIGNKMYMHTNVRWSAVTGNRVWTALEVVANQSWQTFITDTQHGLGAGALGLWFATSCSLCRVYDLKGQLFGTNLTYGWALLGVDKIAPATKLPGYVALWVVGSISLVSRGS